MKPIPNESRSKNVTGSATCRWCGDDGYVVAFMRPLGQSWSELSARLGNPNSVPRGSKKNPHWLPEEQFFEEMAPCPYCEAGYREEFPVPKSSNAHPTSPPWGPDGFWAPRDYVEIQPLYPKGFHPLSRDENSRRWRELRANIAGSITKDFSEEERWAA